VAGIALEVGIEPTLRHAADLGFIPILVEDACGHGNAEAAARSVEALRFAGDTIVTTASDFCGALAG
jgi:nicotinamidase-related amidase